MCIFISNDFGKIIRYFIFLVFNILYDVFCLFLVIVCDSVVVVWGVCEGLKEIRFVFEFIFYFLF